MAEPQTKILVVDDEPAMLEVLGIRLEEWGYAVRMASDGREAGALAESFRPDIVISDVVMPEMPGLDLLRGLKAGDETRPVIMITAQASIEMAVEAMKLGAHDFITKPIDYAKLKSILDAAERDVQLRNKSQRVAGQIERGAGLRSLVGTSRRMREIHDLIKTLGSNDAAVLITGESGTGKELVARTIHELSARSEGPFVAINAAAIPESLIESEIFGHEKGAFTGAVAVRPGCFEMANGGTLFLDEIAEMPMLLQPKLLRVLEDGRVRRLGGRQEYVFDVRILSATNQDPRNAVSQNQLRADLYYRLNVFTVELPPLRERKEDLPLLAQAFILEFNRKHGTKVIAMREETISRIKEYGWPGNVRELRNTMERAVIMCKGEWIELPHLPPYIQNPSIEPPEKLVLPEGITAAEAERELIMKTLSRVGYNKAEAARQLGLDVKTIRNKLRTYGMEGPLG